jgi:hypothetical protein
MYVFKWHIVLNKRKIITLRAKFSHHNLQIPTSLYQIHMLDSRWIADTKDIKQCLQFLRFSHTIDIFVCFRNATQTTQQKLTLHKVISKYTRKIGGGLLHLLLQKESWERKLSDVKHRRFKSLKIICHCTSVFAFGFIGDVKHSVHQTLLVVGITKNTWWYVIQIVICAKWMYQRSLPQNDKCKHYHMVQFVTYANWSCEWVDKKWYMKTCS